MTVRIKSLLELTEHSDYIRVQCKNVRNVFQCSIYFDDENSPHSCSRYITWGYSNDMTEYTTNLFLRAVNAACNTEFVLVGDGE